MPGFGRGQAEAQWSGAVYYYAGLQDPTTYPTYGPKGSLFIRVGDAGGLTYQKQDEGVTTNWTLVSPAPGTFTSFSLNGVLTIPVVSDLNVLGRRIKGTVGVPGQAQIQYHDWSAVFSGLGPHNLVQLQDWIALIDTVGATVQLPVLGGADMVSFIVKDVTGNINPNITILPGAGNNLEGGALSFTMNVPFRGLELHYHGATNTWYILRIV